MSTAEIAELSYEFKLNDEYGCMVHNLVYIALVVHNGLDNVLVIEAADMVARQQWRISNFLKEAR